MKAKPQRAEWWSARRGPEVRHQPLSWERTFAVTYTLASPSNLARPVLRRDAPVICARCGRSVPRQARQQKYCSTHCRELARERTRKAFLGQDTGAPANPPKNANGFKSLPAPESVSSLLHNAIETEIFGNRTGRQAVSSNGVACEVGTWRARTLQDGSAS